MTQWTPQTRRSENKCVPPYFYGDTVLTGFRGSHWLNGSCTQDYGSFAVMPVIGKLKTILDGYALSFTHDQELISLPQWLKPSPLGDDFSLTLNDGTLLSGIPCEI